MSLTIYGASDDLVEVDGDVREEFNPSGDGPSYLAVSDGTVLRITYDGRWRIDRIMVGSSHCEHAAAEADNGDARDDEFGTPIYSDRVTLTRSDGGELAWVVFGDRFEARP